MDDEIIDLPRGPDGGAGVRQLTVGLSRPRSRLRLRVEERGPGRAEAVLEGRSWAAKHYWQDADGLWIYEFDEPLPAGQLTLRVPFATP